MMLKSNIIDVSLKIDVHVRTNLTVTDSDLRYFPYVLCHCIPDPALNCITECVSSDTIVDEYIATAYHLPAQ